MDFYPILATWVHEDPLIVHLTIDGELIETTPEHPFRLANGDWVPAAALEIGTNIQRANGTTGLVAGIEFSHDSQLMYNLTVATAHTYFVGDGQWLVHNSCFKIEGQLKEIWDNPRYFKNWLKNTQSLRRVDSPLSHTEAMQILENAQKHGIPVDLNSAGLQGLEITGQWAGIPHFKVANVHIPVQLGFKP